MIVESVRALAREQIAAGTPSTTTAAPSSRGATAKAINPLGLNAMFIPEAYGGAPLSYAAYLACVREISKACASTGIIWATNFPRHQAARRFRRRGAEEAPAAAHRAGRPRLARHHRAVRRLGCHRHEDALSPRGRPHRRGRRQDLHHQRRRRRPDPAFGKWSEIDDEREAISALILEKGTPGLSVVRTEDKMGHRASSTATLAFDGCRVPRANLLGAPGEGLALLLASLNRSRPSVAAHALGIARGVRGRGRLHQRAAPVGPAHRRVPGSIQFRLLAPRHRARAVRGVARHVARLVDGGAQDFGIEASMLKMRASDLAMRIATEAVQLHGGYGYCKDYRVERLMRDAKITQIWEGTNQIHRQLIGRSFDRKG